MQYVVKIMAPLLCGVSKTDPLPTPINFNVFSGQSDAPPRASRVGCPLISIDGTHLYGKYWGSMFVAVRIDTNDQLFLLAFTIVEGVNNDNWGWFMACIGMRVTQRPVLCVI